MPFVLIVQLYYRRFLRRQMACPLLVHNFDELVYISRQEGNWVTFCYCMNCKKYVTKQRTENSNKQWSKSVVVCCAGKGASFNRQFGKVARTMTSVSGDFIITVPRNPRAVKSASAYWCQVLFVWIYVDHYWWIPLYITIGEAFNKHECQVVYASSQWDACLTTYSQRKFTSGWLWMENWGTFSKEIQGRAPVQGRAPTNHLVLLAWNCWFSAAVPFLSFHWVIVIITFKHFHNSVSSVKSYQMLLEVCQR